ncbi:THxN family PEP-CTERM protein [Agarivorans sp. DSG3-1]|uniref:THxN family PEP-CTERM protein n=1 Tax=Agarivorans sp. DSG3-1 TaxID=3342249 RepID=UPI00398F756A
MNKLKHACLAVSLGLASISASAELITEWNYANDAGFKEWSSRAGQVGIDTDGATLDDFDVLFGGELPKSLAWGDPYGAVNPLLKKSSLVIDDAQSGQVNTSAPGDVASLDFVTGTGLTHENWGVTGNTLSSAVLFDGLFLQPLAPFVGPALPAPVLEFDVLFEETYNTPTNNVCKYGDTKVGEAGVNEAGCSDLFTLVLDDGVTFSEVGGDIYLQNSFILPIPGFDDYVYTLTTRLQGLEVLDGLDCGPDATCIGFLTEENQTNQLEAAFAISAAKVTEPGTLAIFGLGLLGLASVRRRA